MTFSDLTALPGLSGKTSAAKTEITGVYCGDLLSHVMGKAPAGSAWVTVMNNINSVAVASLTEIACIVFADGIAPSDEVLERAGEKGISIALSASSIFETAFLIYRVLEKGD